MAAMPMRHPGEARRRAAPGIKCAGNLHFAPALEWLRPAGSVFRAE